MTEIAFHVNTPDKLDYACRLLRASQKKAAKVLVCGQPDVLRQLSTALWAMTPVEFLPHCFVDAPPAVLANSPIVLLPGLMAELSTEQSEALNVALQQEVLLNLGAALPSGFERFARLIEVVSQDDADLQSARVRWKHYKDRGYALTRYDAVSKLSTSH